jgi:aminopeptidase N
VRYAPQFYESKFNVKYPLPKSDMVAIPDFAAGAMEVGSSVGVL